MNRRHLLLVLAVVIPLFLRELNSWCSTRLNYYINDVFPKLQTSFKRFVMEEQSWEAHAPGYITTQRIPL